MFSFSLKPQSPFVSEDELASPIKGKVNALDGTVLKFPFWDPGAACICLLFFTTVMMEDRPSPYSRSVTPHAGSFKFCSL
jgi:hypothetical protein